MRKKSTRSIAIEVIISKRATSHSSPTTVDTPIRSPLPQDGTVITGIVAVILHLHTTETITTTVVVAVVKNRDITGIMTTTTHTTMTLPQKTTRVATTTTEAETCS